MLQTTNPSAASKSVGPLPAGHPAVSIGKVGVILVNLGTPEGTEPAPMRRYLKEFLSDRRVIEWPRAIWYPVLYGIVLNTRPKKSGRLYEKIWNRERNESPLRTFTRSQSDKLAGLLADHPQVHVDWAMRYGEPSIESVIARMTAEGCDRILAFPLYPQYSATTTATVNDKVFEALMKMRFMPALRTVPAYHDEPAYIEALATSIQKHLAGLDFEPDVILASFHGIPQSYFRRGDPYHCQCLKTTRLLRERLGMDEKRLMATFQSRFGPGEWLQPYTDRTVERLAREGVKKIATFNPGFVSDCLETLEEIAIGVRKTFLANGGEHFAHIPCLNDSDEGIAVIEHMARRELSGWV
jgi:protoporphyrin/coproporphyrin ferrochelatase